MRIWLDPAKLNNYQLTPGDVASAISAQNVQVSSGQLGGLPAVAGQQLNATIVGKTRLQTAEQFGNIFLKVSRDGAQVRLRDVATVSLGAENYSTDAQFNGKPASGLAIKLSAGANALDTAKAIRATVSQLEPFFPPGMKVVYPYDTTPVTKESISGVIHTLGEAIILVFLVMYLFLQNFRATIITTMTVPVVLLGTFGILAAAGFTINTLTMFGMILPSACWWTMPSWWWKTSSGSWPRKNSRPRPRRKNPWSRSRAHWSVSRWCCRRFCCQWRSSVVPPV